MWWEQVCFVPMSWPFFLPFPWSFFTFSTAQFSLPSANAFLHTLQKVALKRCISCAFACKPSHLSFAFLCSTAITHQVSVHLCMHRHKTSPCIPNAFIYLCTDTKQVRAFPMHLCMHRHKTSPCIPNAFRELYNCSDTIYYEATTSILHLHSLHFLCMAVTMNHFAFLYPFATVFSVPGHCSCVCTRRGEDDPRIVSWPPSCKCCSEDAAPPDNRCIKSHAGAQFIFASPTQRTDTKNVAWVPLYFCAGARPTHCRKSV